MATVPGLLAAVPDRQAHAAGAGSGSYGLMEMEIEAEREKHADLDDGATVVSRRSSQTSLYEDAQTDQKKDAQVQMLARKASRQASIAQEGDQDPFSDNRDPRLDPHSPSFNAKAYAQAILSVHSRDERAAPHRRAGVAFRNLTAHGYGTDTDFQVSYPNNHSERLLRMKVAQFGNNRKQFRTSP